jgi:hypothetical protein
MMRHEQLASLRGEFGTAAARCRSAILRGMAMLTDPDAAKLYHDELLYCTAYPDSERITRLVDRQFRQVAAIVHGRIKSGADGWDDALEDSGIDGTNVMSSFSAAMLTWLAEKWPRDVSIDWDDESLGEAFEEFLPALASRVEWDGLLADRLSTREWLRLAGGGSRRGEALVLGRMLKRLAVDGPVLDRAWESAEVYLKWRLTGPLASITFNRFPKRVPFFQDQPLLRSVDLREITGKTLPNNALSGATATRNLIDTCRAALAVRGREINTLTYVNPREVSLFRLDRGIDVALFGLTPKRRLPIESYFGFMAARNRVPMAYGGAWIMWDRAEIGVNVFDAFRGGESAFLFSQVMRVYAQRFGARRFYVDPFQFGRDNPEAIKSGAFWFYYRLGFRPIDRRLDRLAALHWATIIADRKYRCSAQVLRKLAGGRLAIDLESRGAKMPRDIQPSELGLAVTKRIGQRFAGDREKACRVSVDRVSRLLGVRGSASWPREERDWFERLSVLFAMIPGLSKWSAREKQGLVTLMRAKGGVSERRYAKMMRGHTRLRSALELIAGSAASG